ncbi:MAG: acetyl-CoA decarbonylase/synthase complex subunit gamma [Promethearchaeota archaeon]
MPAKELSPIEVYQTLPRTNCKECGESNCMAFAAKLVNREAMLDECTPLLDAAHKDAYDKLWMLLKPPVKAVEVGIGEHKVILGGEYVVFRHEFTYFNEPAIAIDVSDEMSDEEFETRVKIVNDFNYSYIGMELTLDMLAIRSTSGNPETFTTAVKKAATLTTKPIVLCALEPALMEQGLAQIANRKPLIYAATKDNWREMANLALMYNCPIVVSSPMDLNGLKSLSKTLLEYGVEDIVLDPGTHPNNFMQENLNNYTILRWDSINEEEEHLGYPLLGVPLVTWVKEDDDPIIKEWNEAVLSSTLIARYTDINILHGISGWAILPQLILRNNIYTDPRKPVSVEPEVLSFGEPTDMSPVLLTTNFALTYYTVASDIEAAKIDCFLIVVDSEGMSVESAVAGRKMTAGTVADAIKEFDLEKKVKHRHLVIPGRSARLSGEIQEATGWKVSVGPMDSSGIAKYIEESWTPTPED